jgi:O-methyltransferase involved in polyketide biosynthesis
MISLSNGSETLFIPLYSKACMSKEEKIISDKKAEEIIDSIDYDFKKLKVAKKIQVFMSLRAAIIDDFTRVFIDENPGCIVIHLGCGLDSRVLRVKRKAKRWYDLDYPEVIKIKKQFFKETISYRMIGSSVTDYGWIDKIDYEDEPVLVIAEGLLMYLNEDEVEELLIQLKNKFTNAEIIFDAFSKTTVKYSKYQTSLERTDAKIQWGSDEPHEIEKYASGITHIDTRYLNDDYRVKFLNGYYRLMFNITRFFKTAREEQRIFIFELRR